MSTERDDKALSWTDVRTDVQKEEGPTADRVTEPNDKKYPQDSYSILAIHGPFGTHDERMFFLFGLLPFLFQVSFLALLLENFLDEKNGTMGSIDNPESGSDGFYGYLAAFIPSQASNLTRVTQILSIVAFLVYPESSVLDAVKAAQFFPRSSEVWIDDPAIGCMRFSCLLRGIQSTLAIMVTLFLVVTNDKVVDIILNFTAVNFISNLDEVAFSVAMSGEFGPFLKEEVERIADTELPTCVHKESKHRCYRFVLGMISVIVFGLVIFVVVCQESNNIWATQTLRVEFPEGSGLDQYSGCFEINHYDVSFSQRRTYNSLGQGINDASFGFCIKTHRWILFKDGGDVHPCDASERHLELAHSIQLSIFDIKSSFGESWYSSSSSAPLGLYFFDSDDTGDKTKLHCDSFLGDGICDPFFNELGFQFDNGDCCAATCTRSNCGKGGLSSVFGNTNFSGVGFPNCNNPEMVPITIHLNEISSSRDPDFAEYDFDREYDAYGRKETEWRTKTPENPYFALDCDGKTVMTVYIEQTMVNNSETVMVEDGADCSLVVRNTTTNSAPDVAVDDPIWFINYTLFHGDKNTIEAAEILTQHSSKKESVNFKVIPGCYFRKLGSHIDLVSIYKAFGSSNEAIDWLVEDDRGNLQCEDNNFIERYALANVFFAMNGTAKFISRERLCRWPSITCNEGKVSSIRLRDAGLRGAIPSGINLLRSLKELQLSDNQITSLPSEIGLMSSLQTLDLGNNAIPLIPSEIGLLTNLVLFDLSNQGNNITKDDLPKEVSYLCFSYTSTTDCVFDQLIL